LGFTRLIRPLISMISFYSADWKKKSMGKISDLKTRWSLRWEHFDQNLHSNALTNLRRMDREITWVYCE
jgi:hypothetical protein